jgi:hypothetical protein
VRHPDLRRLATALTEDEGYHVNWTKDTAFIATADDEILIVGRGVDDEDWHAYAIIAKDIIVDGAGGAGETVEAVEEWLDAGDHP